MRTNKQIKAQLDEAARRTTLRHSDEPTFGFQWKVLTGAGGYDLDLPMLLREAAKRIPPDPDDLAVAPARSSDPATSKSAAVNVSAGNARGKLLHAFYRAAKMNLNITSAQAVSMAALQHLASPWKRVSELKEARYIEPCGTATGPRGREVEQYRITDAGIATVEALFGASQIGEHHG